MTEPLIPLKPCPFCGKTPKSWNDDGVTMVYCNNDYCHLIGEVEMSAGAWNTRPIEAQLLEACKEAEDRLEHSYQCERSAGGVECSCGTEEVEEMIRLAIAAAEGTP